MRNFTMDEAVSYAKANGAKWYQSKTVVTAVRLDEKLTWVTSNGDELSAEAGDWKLVRNGKEHTVKHDIFLSTYTNVEGDVYRKTALTMLLQMDEDFTVDTLEGSSGGSAGDWLAVGTNNDAWPIPNDFVLENYL